MIPDLDDAAVRVEHKEAPSYLVKRGVVSVLGLVYATKLDVKLAIGGCRKERCIISRC